MWRHRRKQHRLPALRQPVEQLSNQHRVERIGDPLRAFMAERDYDADRVGPAQAQVARGLVDLEAVPFGDVEHAAARDMADRAYDQTARAKRWRA